MKLYLLMEYRFLERYKLLITNDDGIDGEGLKILAEKLSSVADVYIIAPSSNRSGVSCHITMSDPLEVKKITDNVFTCSGTPVDCVVTAIYSDLLNVKIDAVFSGINKGANLGTDVVYSGTAGAARQAALHDIPAFALSVETYCGEYKFDALAQYAADNLDSLMKLWKKGSYVNINAAALDSYEGMEFASLCNRDYHDKVILEKKGDGWLTHFAGGYVTTDGKPDNDFEITKKGKIAVSLVAANPVLFE